MTQLTGQARKLELVLHSVAGAVRCSADGDRLQDDVVRLVLSARLLLLRIDRLLQLLWRLLLQRVLQLLLRLQRHGR